jgi:peptidoglycan/xylan/chitin deacetylase (PgdA/CDA1 family)
VPAARPSSYPTYALLAVLAVAGAGHAAAQLAARPATSRTIALTFDDLPYVPVESTDYVHETERVVHEITSLLREHGAPAVGFVNEGKLRLDGEHVHAELLELWLSPGVILGNHTYSHADLNAMTAEQYESEITRGEVETRRTMAQRAGAYPLYFRHPYTHTGDTVEKKQAIERFLTGHGYTIVPFTIENSDYVFNVPYVRARRGDDGVLRERLAREYVDYTMAETAFEESMARQIFGRDIPQILLIHANDITADTFGVLLTRFEQRSYRFVSVADAMADPAYSTPDIVTRFGPTWLWRWMKGKNLNVSFKAEPDPPAWVSSLASRP